MRKHRNFWDKNAGRYDRFMRKDRAAYDEIYAMIRPVVKAKTVLELANTAYGYYEEKRNGNEEEEVDYEELLERIEGGTFRDNDWGYDEEQDVNSDDDKDLKDMNLKQLEALSGLEGDCSEIDEHLINVVTTMNEMQTFQSTVKVMVNRLVHCRS